MTAGIGPLYDELCGHLEKAGVTAAPQHLLGHTVAPASVAGLPESPSDTELRR